MVRQLITERQRELNERAAALQRVAASEGYALSHEMDVVQDELQFLIRLAKAWLAQLEAASK